MKINKITSGFVIQTYDTDLMKWTGQEFVAGDQTEYEEAGTARILAPTEIWPNSSEPYLPFLMRQPDEIADDRSKQESTPETVAEGIAEPASKAHGGIGNVLGAEHQHAADLANSAPALAEEIDRLRYALRNAASRIHGAAIWFGTHGPGHAAEQEEYMQYHNEAARALGSAQRQTD